MGFISITKTRKPRQFHYIPRYYNERKERLQAIVSRIQNLQEDNDTITSAALSQARLELEFREARTKRKAKIVRQQRRRTIIILGALCLLLYIYFRL